MNDLGRHMLRDHIRGVSQDRRNFASIAAWESLIMIAGALIIALLVIFYLY